MRSFLDPLNTHHDRNRSSRVRILSDAGIKEAITSGLIKITPAFNPDKDLQRIQPATLDVKLRNVDEVGQITHDPTIFDEVVDCLPRESTTFKARTISTINLTELIDFGQLHGETPQFMGMMSECRSSVRRLGAYMANSGAYFFSGPEFSTLEVGNFSPNNLLFGAGERVAQLFFRVYPFADRHFAELHPDEPSNSETGEKVRSLEMGIEIGAGSQLHYLQQKGFLKISPLLKTSRGKIIVHASDKAYRMKTIEGGIDFSKRDNYTKDVLLEPIDISRGYIVKPGTVLLNVS